MAINNHFLYLSEEDAIQAGVLDMKRCVDVAEEVFSLLGQGDYLMGGNNHNSHGLGIVFPKESPFPNMPVAGPDRRFVAMPAYLGGRFDVCGNKWYGSNAENTKNGLPRSVLTLMLNDKTTGEPLALMSANLISAMRTGAVPGVAVRKLAKKDAKVCTVIGCGPINRSCYEAIISQLPSIEKVICYDLFEQTAVDFLGWSKQELHVDGSVTSSIEEAIREGDVVTIAASRLKPVEFQDEWVKEGATVLFTGPGHPDEAFWLNNRIVYDNIGLHEAYVEEAIASGDKAQYYNGVIGGPIYRLIDEGKLPALADSVSLGDIVLGKQPGRTNDQEKIAFVACGMAVFDVAWGYELYQQALQKNVGQKLCLWETPYQCRKHE